MTIEVNGIAHIQLTVANAGACLPFWEALCNFIEMKTLVRNDTTVYCIGSRTGILVKEVPEGGDTSAFDQYRPGLHHLCLRARSREDIDHIYAFVVENLDAKIVHGPEDGEHFAPGYYSILFEDPDGIRVEFNYVPGRGHFGDKGRLGPQGAGPAGRYDEEGLNDQ